MLREEIVLSSLIALVEKLHRNCHLAVVTAWLVSEKIAMLHDDVVRNAILTYMQHTRDETGCQIKLRIYSEKKMHCHLTVVHAIFTIFDVSGRRNSL